MAGNVEEWCLDLFENDFYKSSIEIDPVNTKEGEFGVLRGGSFRSEFYELRSYKRKKRNYFWNKNIHTIGFRLVIEKINQ
ncbi:MAG: SUMF1/EgtB/PvdO family nonheme iron enzyme [Leptospiraceae bacterium]|nr:SUMF1/EgtB/PvdO family nonheme iron enzyme [Leptospiraceae bacterium]